MSKKVFINGNIVIKTRYFVPKEIGCGYSEPPAGSIILEPSDEVEGMPCLLIDDEHPQSLFNEYYAKGFVTTDAIASSYLIASYQECIHEYAKRVEDICKFIRYVASWEEKDKTLAYKMAYVTILTALDALICYVVLKRSIRDEFLFKDIMFFMAPKTKCCFWVDMIDIGQIGKWEQDAIRYIQRSSFLNTNTIDEVFNKLGFARLVYDRNEIRRYFRVRHIIIHRSGRQRDDSEIMVTYDNLSDLINTSHTLVGAIYDSICLTLLKEQSDKKIEKDIEEVFPGGIVRAPYRLSDLARLLGWNSPVLSSEPIHMPTL